MKRVLISKCSGFLKALVKRKRSFIFLVKSSMLITKKSWGFLFDYLCSRVKAYPFEWWLVELLHLLLTCLCHHQYCNPTWLLLSTTAHGSVVLFHLPLTPTCLVWLKGKRKKKRLWRMLKWMEDAEKKKKEWKTLKKKKRMEDRNLCWLNHKSTLQRFDCK